MSLPNPSQYLQEIAGELRAQWPDNRTVNIVCHGHSVPAGHFAPPFVDSLNAYPHLLHVGLKQRFPFAVINVIVTAVGGENSDAGSSRFAAEVLCHRPDVVLIDYALNDRCLGLPIAKQAWKRMIQAGMQAGVKMLLLTPTADHTQALYYPGDDKDQLGEHAAQIRSLAEENSIGLVDSFAAFQKYQKNRDVSDLLSWINHPNRRGHELVAREILRWFPAA